MRHVFDGKSMLPGGEYEFCQCGQRHRYIPRPTDLPHSVEFAGNRMCWCGEFHKEQPGPCVTEGCGHHINGHGSLDGPDELGACRVGDCPCERFTVGAA